MIQDRVIPPPSMRDESEEEEEEEEESDEDEDEDEVEDGSGSWRMLFLNAKPPKKKSRIEEQEEQEVAPDESEDNRKVQAKYDNLVRQFVAVNTAKSEDNINVEDIPNFNTRTLRYKRISTHI